MRRLAAAALAGGALLFATPAAARTIDYAASEADFAAHAEAIGAPAPLPLPARGGADVVVEGLDKLDHRVAILGISCRAWVVENPLSQMVTRILTGWDQDGLLEPGAGAPLLRITIAEANSSMRCVEVRELVGRCLMRTRIEGEAVLERPGAAPLRRPFAIENDQVHTRPGMCASLSRGGGLSGRAAAIELVDRLQAMLAAD